jgi:UDP-GlcNAc3NAcA epimerase
MKTIKICTIIGARPQYIKAAMLSKAIKKYNIQKTGFQIKQLLIHTGQHYDKNMYLSFFEQFQVPVPDIDLGISGGTNAEQIFKMTDALLGFAEAIKQMDYVLVFGDTNSTAAGVLAAGELNKPLIHVEAGLRCFKEIPEEINRKMADRAANLLFSYSASAIFNLENEGIFGDIYDVGDITYDAFLENKTLVSRKDAVSFSYYLATVHRAENVNDPYNLLYIFRALNKLKFPIIVPVHPNTKQKLKFTGEDFSNIKFISPISYPGMLYLERGATKIITDSGGIQKEAAWWGVPCVTLRNETEEVDTVMKDWNTLVGANPSRIQDAVSANKEIYADEQISAIKRIYGEGNTATKIIERIVSCDLH